jgi:hypothetical protein
MTMTNRITARIIVSGAALASAAGLALAVPTVDGTLGAGELSEYGPAKWVQTSPTSMIDNVGGGSCDDNAIGTPGAVTTGIELKIPLSAIGNPTGDIRVSAFFNGSGHQFVSNQVLGGVAAGTDNLGEPRTLDFSSIAGNQYVTIPSAVSVTAPTVDGTLDAGVYGAALALQTNRTGFGDNTDATPTVANGNELDGAYAVISGGNLYLMLTGNQATDFTKIEVFIDSVAGGYNQLLETDTFPNVDFDSLARLKGNSSVGVGAIGPGLKFDAAFSADYYLTWGSGGAPASHFPNFADLVTTTGGYLGSCVTGGGNGILAGGTNPSGIEIAIDDSNIAGVPASCPPPAGNPDTANGSEMDNVYAYIDTPSNTLYVFVGGNLRNNFSKFHMFFDMNENAEGQITIGGNAVSNVDIDFGALQRMGPGTEGPGVTFDSGFTADYWLGFTNGNNIEVYANAAVLRANGRIRGANQESYDYGAFDGGDKTNFALYPINFDGTRLDVQDGFTTDVFCSFGPRLSGDSLALTPLTPTGAPNKIRAAINNSNTAGVTETAVTGAAAVNTGIELAFDLAELGWDGTSCIKIAAWMGDNNSVISNQVLGGLPGGLTQTALGEIRAVNFASIAGDQFITLGSCAPVGCWGEPCVADFDDGSNTGTPDGGVTIDDLIYYLGLFEAGDVCADVDDGSGTNTLDGGVTIDDLIYYLGRFEAGC